MALNVFNIVMSQLFESFPSECRLAIHIGSLYASQVAPFPSSQANALSGKSSPIVGELRMRGVPARGAPKISTSIGDNIKPAAAAAAE